MITEVRIFTATQDELQYSTVEGDMDNDLEAIEDFNRNGGFIRLKLKDGSIDEFVNVQFCITTRKEKGDLI